jgi:glutaredoxin
MSPIMQLQPDDIQVARYSGTGLPGLVSAPRVGLGLVLFIQEKCDYCNFALSLLEDLSSENVSTYVYDMTKLSTEKLTAIDSAAHFAVTMTPTLILFCNGRPVTNGVLAGWQGTKDGGVAAMKFNAQRIETHFKHVYGNLHKACAPQAHGAMDDAQSSGDDDDYDDDEDDKHAVSDNHHMTGQIHTNFWQKAASVPH